VRLKAGQTLWTFGIKGGLIALHVVSSRYDNHGDIELTCWMSTQKDRSKPKTVTINRFGFVEFDNANERQLHERTSVFWVLLYRTRRAAERRLKRKAPCYITFDQIREKYSYERDAERLGFKSPYVAFYKKDVQRRLSEMFDKLLNSEPRATKTPTGRYSYQMDTHGNIHRIISEVQDEQHL
jgi:hypothetical protein